MEFKNIILSFDGYLVTITMNRPPVNALNEETLDEIDKALNEISDNEEARVVLINSSSEKAFIAGADIKRFTQINPEEARNLIRKGQDLFDKIEAFPIPIIAAVNGFCLGGGCELAMACHIRIASEKAIFGQPEINLGIVPGFAGSQRLPRLINKTKALELLLTGDSIDSKEAFSLGLVNKVVSAEKLDEEAKNLAAKIAKKAPLAVKATIKLVNEGMSLPFKEAEKLEEEAFVAVFSSEDGQEGINAFLEKRKPEFKNK